MTEPSNMDRADSSSPLLELHGEALTEVILDALMMACKDAHLLAYQTGTGVVTRRNGKLEVIPPDPAMYEDLIPPPFEPSE